MLANWKISVILCWPIQSDWIAESHRGSQYELTCKRKSTLATTFWLECSFSHRSQYVLTDKKTWFLWKPVHIDWATHSAMQSIWNGHVEKRDFRVGQYIMTELHVQWCSQYVMANWRFWVITCWPLQNDRMNLTVAVKINWIAKWNPLWLLHVDLTVYFSIAVNMNWPSRKISFSIRPVHNDCATSLHRSIIKY